MTVMSDNMLRMFRPVKPFLERQQFNGVTFGCGPAGYDVRVAERVRLWPGRFVLASTVEKFHMPNDWIGIVHDKSTWARRGVALQNTVIEPGWKGYLTLEITMHAWKFLTIEPGTAIAQVIFHKLDQPAARPYDGKYQNQQRGPQEAR